MKKGEIYEGIVSKVEFPNKCHIDFEGGKCVVKNAIEGQKLKFMISKLRKGKAEGRILEVLEKSPLETAMPCKHFGVCGGCTYQTLAYEEQLKLKERQVKEIIDAVCSDYEFEGIIASPVNTAYRNKMEYSFGDEYKDGPLALGMHKKGSFHDIVTVDDCQIVDSDYNEILKCVLEFFKERPEIPFYHKMQHTGYLRHLLVRKAVKTQDILVDIVTTTQMNVDMKELVSKLLELKLSGTIVGVLHTFNDSLADVVQNDSTKNLYGQDYFYESLLGLLFKISPFSFFQTNSLGAELLYEKAREYIGTTNDKVIFDLYSGTGTIAQILAPVAKKVVGVEIVEEAVEAAKINAMLNGLENCKFIAGDVLKVIDTIKEKPDLIVLDPPRDGINPKALSKIIAYGVDKMVYISCKPTSLARDLVILQENGYKVEKVCAVDMFPSTSHVETVCLLSK
ncbi:MAG: 23S rRNA (uracil(1939)-C(5))-methyltransferase RlmD [Lachnospiraceae bacterium]|nr:23S rRNA (uracil(1939)-C(5))-methyltransferase RlmD [Lachnospiraceae bacterium]